MVDPQSSPWVSFNTESWSSMTWMISATPDDSGNLQEYSDILIYYLALPQRLLLHFLITLACHQPIVCLPKMAPKIIPKLMIRGWTNNALAYPKHITTTAYSRPDVLLPS